MKSKFAAFALLFLTVFVLASCLSTDDNYTYTDDSAITSFSISSGKQYVHVKSSTGGDSIVTKDLTLSTYKFYIDQLSGEIYNPDSLPCGTDAEKLLCSVSSYNSGTVVIKSLTSDTLSFVTTVDSLDFSKERELQVYSNSGLAVRKYKVKVNVHQEFPDSFAWHAKPYCDALRSLTAVKTVATDGGLLLFGTNGTNTIAYRFTTAGWTQCIPNFNHVLAADAYKGVVTKDGRAYMSDGGNIISTTDGNTWTETGTNTGITRLVAASRFRIYGYANDGRLMASANNGNTWTVATIDEDLALLPTDETAYVAYPLTTNKLVDRVLLLGTRNKTTYPNDTNISVWGKIDEGAEGSENQPWTFYDVTEENKHKAPMLTTFSALCYDGAVYMFGGKESATPKMYKTLDNGITWKNDTVLVVPNDFDLGITVDKDNHAYSMTVDKDNVLWLVNANNGKTWNGRINRLGWKKEQTDITE